MSTTELTATVITASNRAAAGVYEDTGGPLIVEALTGLGFEVTGPVVVPDGQPSPTPSPGRSPAGTGRCSPPAAPA